MESRIDASVLSSVTASFTRVCEKQLFTDVNKADGAVVIFATTAQAGGPVHWQKLSVTGFLIEQAARLCYTFRPS